MPTLDLLPHPITSEGRETYQLPAMDDMRLSELLAGVRDEVWEEIIVVVDGEEVTLERRAKTIVRDNSIIQVRATAQGGDSNPLAVILSIAILVAAPYAAGALLPATASAGLIAGATAVIGAAGLLAINTLFPPRIPDIAGADTTQPERQYTLSAGSNPIRAYGPLGLVLGEHRIFPDFAARPYTELISQPASNNVLPITAEAATGPDGVVDPGTWTVDPAGFGPWGIGFGGGYNPFGYNAQGSISERNAQFLYQLFDLGIGDLEASEDRFGDTAITDYDDIETEVGPDITLVAGNVDSADGGELDTAMPIARTSPENTNRIVVNLVSQHYEVDEDDGRLIGRTNNYTIRYRPAGSADAWTESPISLASPSGGDGRVPVRRAFAFDVTAGEWDVEVELDTMIDTTAERVVNQTALFSINFYQAQVADYTDRNVKAIKIRASGQLSGVIRNYSVLVRQRVTVPDPDNLGEWIDGHSRNPAYILRKFWLGFYDSKGRLQAGRGRRAETLDNDNLFAFGRFCDRHGLECNLHITDPMSEHEVETLIAQCGWGAITKASGKWGVVWDNEDEPVTVIFTPANIVADSISVRYDNENLADEIIGSFQDRHNDYQETPVRRVVTGVEHPKRPANIRLRGVTNLEQAAKEVNRIAASQEFHARAITFDLSSDGGPGFVAQGSVGLMAHDLIGSTLGATVIDSAEGNRYRVDVYENAVLPASGYIWLWMPDGNTISTTFVRIDDEWLETAITIPIFGYHEDTAVESLERYRIALFAEDAEAVRVRVTAVIPSESGLTTIVVRDEYREYYDARVADLTWPILPRRIRYRALPPPPRNLPGADGTPGEMGIGVPGLPGASKIMPYRGYTNHVTRAGTYKFNATGHRQETGITDANRVKGNVHLVVYPIDEDNTDQSEYYRLIQPGDVLVWYDNFNFWLTWEVVSSHFDTDIFDVRLKYIFGVTEDQRNFSTRDVTLRWSRAVGADGADGLDGIDGLPGVSLVARFNRVVTAGNTAVGRTADGEYKFSTSANDRDAGVNAWEDVKNATYLHFAHDDADGYDMEPIVDRLTEELPFIYLVSPQRWIAYQITALDSITGTNATFGIAFLSWSGPSDVAIADGDVSFGFTPAATPLTVGFQALPGLESILTAWAYEGYGVDGVDDQEVQYKLRDSAGDFTALRIADNVRSATITGLAASAYLVRLKYELHIPGGQARGTPFYTAPRIVLPSDDFGAKFIAEITVGITRHSDPARSATSYILGYYVRPSDYTGGDLYRQDTGSIRIIKPDPLISIVSAFSFAPAEHVFRFWTVINSTSASARFSNIRLTFPGHDPVMTRISSLGITSSSTLPGGQTDYTRYVYAYASSDSRALWGPEDVGKTVRLELN